MTDINIYIQEFERCMRAKRFAMNTFVNYRSCMVKLLNHFNKEPHNISYQDLQNYLIATTSVSYHRHIRASIQCFWQMVLGITLSFKSLPYPKSESKLPTVLSEDEIQKLIDATLNDKHKLLIVLQYNCALRVSELINIKFTDIYRNKLTIRIRQGKNRKDRDVPITKEILELMAKYYRAWHPKAKEYLFEGDKGGQYSIRSIQEVFKSCKKRSGMGKRCGTHSLRHSAATHRLEHGTDLRIIQVLLGHSKSSTTERYTLVAPALLTKTYQPANSLTF